MHTCAKISLKMFANVAYNVRFAEIYICENLSAIEYASIYE